MAILANVPGMLAVASDTIVFDETLAAMLAGIGTLARIDVAAIVERHFTNDTLRFDDITWLNKVAIDFDVAYAAHQAESCRFQTAADDYLVADVERQAEQVALRVLVVDGEAYFAVLVVHFDGVPRCGAIDFYDCRMRDIVGHVGHQIEAKLVRG